MVTSVWICTVYRTAVSLYIKRMATADLCSIVFRSLQGIGGSGIYALAMTSVTEICAIEQFGLASGAVSAMLASASVLGPILGGVISSRTTWRWVFWLK
jgi:MFS family permease